MLVSVLVLTFNSEKYVAETLESIRHQSYGNLELIISDDYSTDNTVEVCKSWLIKHTARFVRTELLTVNKNTGVAANCNRSLKSARGEWIKFCAGDDSLKPSCIEDNVSWIATKQDVRVLFSLVEVYRETFKSGSYVKTTPCDPFNSKGILAPGRCAKSQYKMLLKSDRIHFTPSSFFHRHTLLSVGAFDERYKKLEDYPLWLKLTREGHKLHFMNLVTVNYRQHENAINNTTRSYLINPNYFISEIFRREYTYPFLPVDIRLDQKFTWIVSQLFRFEWLNRDLHPNKLLFNLSTVYLNPFKYVIWIKKRVFKKALDPDFYS